MQWWHSKVLKAGCSVRKILKSRIWNTQAASYDFLGMNQQNFATTHKLRFLINTTYFFLASLNLKSIHFDQVCIKILYSIPIKA